MLGEAARSTVVRALEEEMRTSPRVRALVAAGGTLGRPATRRRVYYKWQGLHWVLASLADIGYPHGDKALFHIRDRVLELWLAPQYFREHDAKTRAAAYGKASVPRMNGRYRRCGSQQGKRPLLGNRAGHRR